MIALAVLLESIPLMLTADDEQPCEQDTQLFRFVVKWLGLSSRGVLC